MPALKINKFIPPSVDRMMAEFNNTKFFCKPLPIVNMSAPSKSGFSLKGHAQIRLSSISFHPKIVS